MDSPLLDDVARNQTYAHRFARILVRPMLGTRVRPNHLTLLRLLVGLVACALLAQGSRTADLWSGALWVATCVLDRADGELARMGDLRSESGKVLDYYSDMLLDALWFLAAGFSVRHGWLGDTGMALGVLVCASMLLCIGYAELFERLSGPGVKAWNGVQHFHPDDALFLLAPLTWLGWVGPVLLAASVCTPLIAAVLVARTVALKRQMAAAERH
jgi:archaetidylinositol phosphate synthase